MLWCEPSLCVCHVEVKNIQSIVWRRKKEVLDDLPCKDTCQSNEHWNRSKAATLGELLRDEVERIWAFPSA